MGCVNCDVCEDVGSGDSFQYGGKGFVHGYDNTNNIVILVVLLDISFLLNYK